MYAVGNGLPQELLVVSSLEEANACAQALNGILPHGCEAVLRDPLYKDTDIVFQCHRESDGWKCPDVYTEPADEAYQPDQP